MSTISNLETTTNGVDSRTIINTNFSNLNADKMEKSGGTMTGKIEFSGTGHAGIRLNNLTTAERDALTPEVGDKIFNTTAGEEQVYDGTNWVSPTGAVDASETAKGLVEIATTTEVNNGTETGSTGAYLATSPAGLAASKYGSQLPTSDEKAAMTAADSPASDNAFLVESDTSETATASKIPVADSNGYIDGVYNKTAKNFTAGETINGATLPVAVYQNTSDNKIYACDGNDIAKLNFLGFAISNSTDTNPIKVQTNGIVSGFTGLTEGSYYYVQDDKTIGATVGTYEIKVGVAISETEILISKNQLFTVGNSLLSSLDTERTVKNTATYQKLKEIIVRNHGQIKVYFEGKTSSNASAKGKFRIYVNGVAVGTERSLTNQTTYQVYTENINVVSGDLVQLYANDDGSNYDAYVRNFRIYINNFNGATTSTDTSVSL